MKKKNNLTAYMIAIMIMLCSLPVSAQEKVGYVQWDRDTYTLTFYGGESVPELNDSRYEYRSLDTYQSSGCIECQKVVFDASFKDIRPTSSAQWFQHFGKLQTIEGIENLNTEEVTDMSYMFSGCSNLISLDLTSFNTATVTDMSYMFSDCSSLTSIDLTSFNVKNVTSLQRMFSGCSSLTSLNLLSFNTNKVQYVAGMFNGCSSLTSIDLTSFNTVKVKNMSNVFKGCSSLQTIYVSDAFYTYQSVSSASMFEGCSSLKGKVAYDPEKTDRSMANYENGYFTKSSLTPYVKWDAKNNVLTFKVANAKEAGEGVYELNEGDAAPGWSSYHQNCTKVVFTPSFRFIRPTSCYAWFLNFDKLQTIEGIDNLNTENVTNMSSMFRGCSGLTHFDLSSFNTEKVTNMNGLFYGCSGLTHLDLSSFNTKIVTDMNDMFGNCFDLTTIYVSDDFSANSVTASALMFAGCNSLSGAAQYNASQTDQAMANYENGYFTKSSLTPYVKWDANVGVLTFYVANAKDTGEGVYELNEGEAEPGWVTHNSCTKVVFAPSFKQVRPTSCANWFYRFSELQTIEGIENLNTEEVTDMNCMFYYCSSLTSLDLSSFNTAQVENMRCMFSYCMSLTSLDLSTFNTGKVTDMDAMFAFCVNLTSLDLTPFNTDKVTDISFMFNGCERLNSLDLSSFNTEKVTNMRFIFFNCSALTSLNLSSFNTEKVENMLGMFANCAKLTSLDLSSFNTKTVTNMSSMFYNCSALTSLNLSSFNTEIVENMNGMFAYCPSLKTIYVSDEFSTECVTESPQMFEGSSSLVGAVAYNESQFDPSMANYKTGYFKTYYTLGDKKVDLCGETLLVESLDLSGDKDFVAHAPFKSHTTSYTRDLSSSNSTWFSLCLPFAFTPQNFTAYQLKSATNDAVEMELVTGTVAAGTPVLFRFKDGTDKIINLSATEADIVKMPAEGTIISSTDGHSLRLFGTYQGKTFSKDADNNTFILQNDKLMNPAKMLENSNVTKVGSNPFRAYMTLSASAELPTQPANAKSFSIGHGDEETTAIDLLNTIATDDAEYYDINGRRIDAPVKGVNFVRRGNKTVKIIIK